MLIWINIFIDRYEQQIDEMPRFIDTLSREDCSRIIMQSREYLASRSMCNKCLAPRQAYSGKIQIRFRGIFLIFHKKKKKEKRYLIDDWLLWTSYTCMPTSFQLSADIRISDNYCKVDLSISFSFLKNFLIFLNIPNISHLSRFASLFSFLQNFVILYVKIIIATFFFPLFLNLSNIS